MGGSESKDYWVPDKSSPVCQNDSCNAPFSATNRRHHCRSCGKLFCGKCAKRTISVPHRNITTPERVCDECYTDIIKTNNAGNATPRGSPLPSQRGVPLQSVATATTTTQQQQSNSNVAGLMGATKGGTAGGGGGSQHNSLLITSTTNTQQQQLQQPTMIIEAHHDQFATKMDSIRRRTNFSTLQGVAIGVDVDEYVVAAEGVAVNPSEDSQYVFPFSSSSSKARSTNRTNKLSRDDQPQAVFDRLFSAYPQHVEELLRAPLEKGDDEQLTRVLESIRE